MKPVLIAASIAYDRIMDFPGLFKEHFLPDALHNINVSFVVNPPTENFGGCAGNIAFGLALLGEHPDIAESAGNDFDRYDAWFTQHGVSTETIQKFDDIPTASAYITTDKDNNQITAFSPGAGSRPYEKELDISQYALVHVGPSGTGHMMQFVRAAKEHQIPFFFDPGQQCIALSADELKEGIEGAAGVLVNDYELRMITEKTGWSEADIVAKAGFLIVTLGVQGSRILTRDREEKVGIVPAERVVDPTGAGDAYRSGFIKGYLAQLPLASCAKIAGTVAAYAVECYGTQNHRFTIDDLRARYEATYKESFPL